MAVEHTSVSSDRFIPPSESRRLSELWQQLPVNARAEIERRAKANGFSLIDQLRVSFPPPAVTDHGKADKPQPRTTPPQMAELVRALDELIELMKRA